MSRVGDAGSLPDFASSWVGDAIVSVRIDPVNRNDLWMHRLSSGSDLRLPVNTSSNESHGKISPDGRWLAFASDETGRYEVYVRGVVSGGEWPVSTGGNGSGKEARAAKTPDEDEGLLPEISEGEVLNLVTPPGVITEQKFTQPPPRYNEGSLVRELEKRGIGRPSTYAEIISKVQARDYVERLPGGQMKATDLGKIVVDGLVSTSLDFMDPSFTAKMEEELDEVQTGKVERVDLLGRDVTLDQLDPHEPHSSPIMEG